MANALKTLFGDIASAIKEKTGDTATMKPAEFPAKISGISTGTGATILDNIPIELDFSSGNQIIAAPDGALVKSAIIQKPDALTPENIAKGIDIAGIVGEHEGGVGGSVAGAVTVTFCNYDGTELYSRQVFIGDDCPDPVAQGRMPTPTRESTAQYDYSHNGWSTTANGEANQNALKNITADKSVYSAYSRTVRYYNAKFYDSDGTLMKAVRVAYGSQAAPPDTIKTGFAFVGWTPSNLTIYGDTDFYGTWEVDEGWLVRKNIPNDFGETKAIGRAIYSKDGSRVFITSGTALKMYDATVEPYSLLGTYTLTHSANDIVVSPNGALLAVAISKSTGYIHETVYVYKIESTGLTRLTVKSFSTGSADTVYNVAFTADSSKLYVAYGANRYVSEMDLSDLSVQLPTRKFDLPSYTQNYNMDIAFSPDGTKLAMCSAGSYVNNNSYIYNIVDGNFEFEARENNINARFGCAHRVTYSPDGRYLAFGCVSNNTSGVYEVAVFDTSTAPYTRIFVKDTNSTVRDLAFSRDGTMLAVAEYNTPYISVYDIPTGTKRETPLDKPGDACYSVSFNHDDTRLIVGCNTTEHVYLYELRR